MIYIIRTNYKNEKNFFIKVVKESDGRSDVSKTTFYVYQNMSKGNTLFRKNNDDSSDKETETENY